MFLLFESSMLSDWSVLYEKTLLILAFLDSKSAIFMKMGKNPNPPWFFTSITSL
jgi:hypothetical protein